MWERYMGPYTEEQKPFVEVMMKNRILVAVDLAKVVTWDHRKMENASLG
jgi:hypothetical protein